MKHLLSEDDRGCFFAEKSFLTVAWTDTVGAYSTAKI